MYLSHPPGCVTGTSAPDLHPPTHFPKPRSSSLHFSKRQRHFSSYSVQKPSTSLTTPRLISNIRENLVCRAFRYSQNLTPPPPPHPAPSLPHSPLGYCHQQPSGIPPSSFAFLQNAAAREILLKRKSGPVTPPSKFSQHHMSKSQNSWDGQQGHILLQPPAPTAHLIPYNSPSALSAPATLGFSVSLLCKLCLGPCAPWLPSAWKPLFPWLAPSPPSSGLYSNATFSVGPL